MPFIISRQEADSLLYQLMFEKKEAKLKLSVHPWSGLMVQQFGGVYRWTTMAALCDRLSLFLCQCVP